MTPPPETEPATIAINLPSPDSAMNIKTGLSDESLVHPGPESPVFLSHLDHPPPKALAPDAFTLPASQELSMQLRGEGCLGCHGESSTEDQGFKTGAATGSRPLKIGVSRQGRCCTLGDCSFRCIVPHLFTELCPDSERAQWVKVLAVQAR